MKLLLLGSGGREHALAWKLVQSPKVERLFIAPGNAGTSEVGVNVPLAVDDFAAIRDFALKEQIDMLVVGPEIPLVKGISDFFASDSLTAVFRLSAPPKAERVWRAAKIFPRPL